jgi:hypothetical protein
MERKPGAEIRVSERLHELSTVNFSRILFARGRIRPEELVAEENHLDAMDRAVGYRRPRKVAHVLKPGETGGANSRAVRPKGNGHGKR